MTVRTSLTAHAARTAAGHTKEQWGRFYVITRDEVKKLSEAHRNWSRWILIPANEKESLLERINERLQGEGIRPVNMIILKWRMSQLLKDSQKNFSEGDILRGMTDRRSVLQTHLQTQPDSTLQQLISSQSSEHSPSKKTSYDPIRDEFVKLQDRFVTERVSEFDAKKHGK
ncbi:hypothetical protein HBI23_257180 [Parastagonospora nodorum]|nr:hypothetical protein HBI23_257180 [Parastagonospora nodorum]